MPLNPELHRVMIIGSGPIVIGRPPSLTMPVLRPAVR